jgi:BlaI family transcriptional regulator, penicillinase repressor
MSTILLCNSSHLQHQFRLKISLCGILATHSNILGQIFRLHENIYNGTICTMTHRTETKARVRPPLTDLENDIMQIVWSRGASSVEAVHAALIPSRKLKESSVRTILRRLEKKGYLSHESRDRAYLYSAGETPRSLAARAVRQIIDRLCRGSVEELVAGMVDAKVLSEEELDQLAQMARKRRKGTT